MTYSIRNGMARKRMALWWKAAAKSPLRAAWSALCVPHPGQSSPVISFEGQRGKKECCAGSKSL